MDLTQELIRRPSVTPEDAGCQALLIERLERLGFAVTTLDAGGVRNFYAELGSGGPCLAFAGHTDVVPPGEPSAWRSPPFEPAVRDGLLFGRGAADMKASLAAMIVATERFLARQPTPAGRIALLVTSDEEGEARHGTRHIVEHLRGRGIGLDYCIVGEPSSSEALGDTLRNGRRGSLTGTLSVHGIQGHVAYPDAARNPIHEVAPFVKALCEEAFDQGNAHYLPTSLQIANIRAGAGAVNVIPGELVMDFNIRYSTEQTADGLKDRIAALVKQHGLDATLRWHLSGEPFLTEPGHLTACVRKAVFDELGLDCALSTSGGTSDGRFIAPLGCELVELGPVNATIHKIDECVAVADLDRLARVYERILADLLTASE
ncbi:MAG: succinyl-diaminopimelate desuccinylase [Gammaproteobacteria bacterium]|nr:succinyl-diaminopimelate desuccinylase [Gammaproteobacteria bacterium]MDE0273559.1 succinyl-diaminopimelate desuccinylase [Gammaproteobacteria bacterium]